MSLYRRTDTGEIRDLAPAHLAALHPNKQAMWQSYTPPPPPPPALVFVDKDKVVRRLREKGKLGAMRQELGQFTPDRQFEFSHLSRLWVGDPGLRQGITNIGEDPDIILAP